MHKFLLSAAIVGLCSMPVAGFAQDQEHHDARGPRHEEHGGPGEARGHGPESRGPQSRGPEFRGAQSRGPESRGPEQRGPEQRGSNEFRGRERGVQPAPDNAMRGGPPPVNRAMRGGERRDFGAVRNFHQNFNAERHFRVGRYRPPPGYFARRWRWGEVPPSAFWGRDYWILDFDDYDLPPPPYGAVWVRVGDDALLIDEVSGEIIEVDYGVFYY